jgi:hypothetical protein
MFRKKKDKKGGDGDLPDAPNISDDDDAMWFKPTSSAAGTADIALPGMGIPPPAPPSGIRMSISPNLAGARNSPSTSSSQKRFSVNDLVAAINYNDWEAVMKVLDQDPKVAGKNAQVSLKGQTTESNPLHLLVINDPPVRKTLNFSCCVDFAALISLTTLRALSLSLSLSLSIPLVGSRGENDKSFPCRCIQY